MKIKILIIFATITAIGGLFFLGVCFKYLFYYFAEPGNSLRHEYLQGAAIATMLSIPFWISASGFVFLLRASVPKIFIICTYAITAIVCGLFFLGNIYPLIMIAFGK